MAGLVFFFFLFSAQAEPRSMATLSAGAGIPCHALTLVLSRGWKYPPGTSSSWCWGSSHGPLRPSLPGETSCSPLYN